MCSKFIIYRFRLFISPLGDFQEIRKLLQEEALLRKACTQALQPKATRGSITR
jgi:hypothetical protein